MKDKYTLDSDTELWELVTDLKGEGWHVTLVFNKDPKQPSVDAAWSCKALDPEKAKASFNFNSTDIVVPLADQVKVFTAAEYAQNQAIFGGN